MTAKRRMAADECETCLESGSLARRVTELREQAPDTIGRLARFTFDNPGSCALVIAGSVVATRAAGNLVRPRTAVEAIALVLVLSAGLGKLTAVAVDRGWLRIRVRDDNGALVDVRDL